MVLEGKRYVLLVERILAHGTRKRWQDSRRADAVVSIDRHQASLIFFYIVLLILALDVNHATFTKDDGAVATHDGLDTSHSLTNRTRKLLDYVFFFLILDNK